MSTMQDSCLFQSILSIFLWFYFTLRERYSLRFNKILCFSFTLVVILGDNCLFKNSQGFKLLPGSWSQTRKFGLITSGLLRESTNCITGDEIEKATLRSPNILAKVKDRLVGLRNFYIWISFFLLINPLGFS